MPRHRNPLPSFNTGIFANLEPEVVEVGPDGFPKLPAVRPRGAPPLPFER